MSSPLVPTAEIVLGGKERTMRMDLNALADFESKSGKSIMSGGLSDLSALGVKDIRTLLWACLVQDDESLSELEVGRLLHVRNLDLVGEVLQKLMADAMPEEDASAELPLAASSPESSTG